MTQKTSRELALQIINSVTEFEFTIRFEPVIALIEQDRAAARELCVQATMKCIKEDREILKKALLNNLKKLPLAGITKKMEGAVLYEDVIKNINEIL